MKKNTINAILSITFLLITIAATGCKKLDTENEPVDFDVANRTFRVNETPNGAVVDINISQVKPGFANNPYNLLQIEVNSNFNFGYTPDIGDSIKVVVQSTSAFTGYVGYKDDNFEPTIKKTTPDGGLYIEYDYLVTK